MRPLARFWLSVPLALAACGDGGNAVIDGGDGDGPCSTCVDTGVDAPFAPATLAETGLCTDAACTTFAPGVREYAPQFQLWSDGATKRRWIYLPPGTTIDTSDIDSWKFPVGTKLWKEFTSGSVRVETRLISKLLADDTAPGAWFYASYEWNAAQNATTLAPPGAGVPNANGTQHDIPTRSQCKQCHEGVPGRVLGFGAISLDWAAPTGVMDLDDAIAANLLSAPPAGTTPRYPLPGATVDHDALGYLHANCGHCHNPRSATHDITGLELRLETGKLATVPATPAYMTAYNVSGTVGGLTGKIIKPADPAGSVMITRFTATVSPPKMPQIGTEMVDPTGEAALRAWITALN